MDTQGWTFNGSSYKGSLYHKIDTTSDINTLTLYILTREYDGNNINIKDANGNIVLIPTNSVWQSDSIQEYMVTIELNTTTQTNITFEYGRMTPGEDFPGINSVTGSQDGIVGISYGINSINEPFYSNIEYLTSNKIFYQSESIMQIFENQTEVGGTSDLANTKIEFITMPTNPE